ncbi:MAG TPA: ABC transporter ATP-binding protein, partial [Gemmatimonadaceae bacterium]|nr:ABC transporter ATP-binding protein [Gemmatimonadaceae bacterium]
MSAPMRMFPRGDRLPKPEEMLEATGGASQRSARAWVEVRSLLRKHRGYIAAGVVLTLVSRIAGLVLPASSKYFIDHVLVDRRADLLLPLAAVVVGATIVQAATGYALARVLGTAAQRAVADMRRRLAKHVLRLPVERFDATQTGVLASRIMNDPDGIRNLLGSGFVQLLGGLVTATAALGILFWIDWRITSIMLLFLAAIGGGVGFAFAKLRPVNRERSMEFARVAGRLNEALGGIRVLKAYVAERREDLIFARGVHRMLRLVEVTLTGWAAVGALTALAVGAIGATLILAGGRAVLAGSLTLGDLAMYALFTGLVVAPLIQVAQVGTQLSDALAGLERAREMLDEPTEDGRAPTGEPRARLAGAVQVQDMSFEYRAGVPALRHVSFTVPAGTTTALVGPSGSGKSTLLGLLAAFHRPTTGSIRVDDREIGEFDLRRYRAQLGLVLQDTFLFDGTILENIRFSRPDATLDEVKRVARVAHCDEFIERMPERYDTVVGERGVKLSGGQKQRVAIARALLADPSILLLDEATSSLDSESEAMIQEGLDALRRGRTTFVIAHRLSTILSADRILV